MARGSSANLSRLEISLIKAMLREAAKTDQDILAYFTWPTRSVNHRVIAQIRRGAKHTDIEPATAITLSAFLDAWPDVDSDTGLSLEADQLLVKAREALISAVQTFNSAGIKFRSELFIVTSVIAWTYLMHAWLRRDGVDRASSGRQRLPRLL